MIDDIVAKEEMGEYHLDRIFQDTEQYWRDQLFVLACDNDGGSSNNKKNDGDRVYRDYTYDEFQSLWSQVLEYCLQEKFPYYSFFRNNWNDAASSNSNNNANTNENRHGHPTAAAPSTNERTTTTNPTDTTKVMASGPRILEWETIKLISLDDFKTMTTTTA
jgi:hypothetical protein